MLFASYCRGSRIHRTVIRASLQFTLFMNFTIGATSFLEDSAVENEAAKKLPRGGRAKSLGNNGRDVLRREITKRLRAFPQLRIVANRTAPVGCHWS